MRLRDFYEDLGLEFGVGRRDIARAYEAIMEDLIERGMPNDEWQEKAIAYCYLMSFKKKPYDLLYPKLRWLIG